MSSSIQGVSSNFSVQNLIDNAKKNWNDRNVILIKSGSVSALFGGTAIAFATFHFPPLGIAIAATVATIAFAVFCVNLFSQPFVPYELPNLEDIAPEDVKEAVHVSEKSPELTAILIDLEELPLGLINDIEEAVHVDVKTKEVDIGS